MTKRDYELVARVLSNLYSNAFGSVQHDTIVQTAQALADSFSKENPRFRADLFFRAIATKIKE